MSYFPFGRIKKAVTLTYLESNPVTQLCCIQVFGRISPAKAVMIKSKRCNVFILNGKTRPLSLKVKWSTSTERCVFFHMKKPKSIAKQSQEAQGIF